MEHLNDNPVCDCTHADAVEQARQLMLDDELVYDIADFFKIFGDSSRVKLLYTLLEQELCVGDLVAALGMTQSAVSHQLKTLRISGLVKYRKDGKTVYYSLDDEHVSVLLRQGMEHIKHKKGGLNNA